MLVGNDHAVPDVFEDRLDDGGSPLALGFVAQYDGGACRPTRTVFQRREAGRDGDPPAIFGDDLGQVRRDPFPLQEPRSLVGRRAWRRQQAAVLA